MNTQDPKKNNEQSRTRTYRAFSSPNTPIKSTTHGSRSRASSSQGVTSRGSASQGVTQRSSSFRSKNESPSQRPNSFRSKSESPSQGTGTYTKRPPSKRFGGISSPSRPQSGRVVSDTHTHATHRTAGNSLSRSSQNPSQTTKHSPLQSPNSPQRTGIVRKNISRRTDRPERNSGDAPFFDNTKGFLKSTSENITIPPLAAGDLRIIPICGVEGIGTNMIVIEYGEEIIVVDAGFGFSTLATPGVNYTLPNTTYLEERVGKIKALIITHGHMDHVGAIPYIIEKIGNPPIYTREFGALFIQKRMEEFPTVPKLDLHVVSKEQGYITLSENFKVKFFGLTHSIPDSTGVIIQTPIGGVVSTGDVRVENDNGVVKQEEIDQYAFLKNENILAMTIDSTGIEKQGWSVSEAVVSKNIDEIIKNATGRTFIAAFSSQIERLMTFMQSAKKHNKFIALEGRSIKSNLAIADFLKLTDFSHVIPITDIDDHPPHKVVVLVTGAQGEEFAALNRIARDQHKIIKIRENDTIILSSSVVPGNDFPVAQLKNKLFKKCNNVITYNDNAVHTSGHGTREELKWIHSQIPYKFLIPVHGEPYMIRTHARMAERDLGVPRENIAIPENGSVIEIREQGSKITILNEHAPNDLVVVDGNMVGILPEVVMRDRLKLASDGMFVIVVTLDRNGAIKKSPDIISRGFIYLRENQRLLQTIRALIRRTVQKEVLRQKQPFDFDEIKKEIADTTGKYLYKTTEKEPIIIPVVLSV